MSHSDLVYREIIRLLMIQVREEQHSRQVLLKALAREEAVPPSIPSEEEIDERIEELFKVVSKDLTNKEKKSSI